MKNEKKNQGSSGSNRQFAPMSDETLEQIAKRDNDKHKTRISQSSETAGGEVSEVDRKRFSGW